MVLLISARVLANGADRQQQRGRHRTGLSADLLQWRALRHGLGGRRHQLRLRHRLQHYTRGIILDPAARSTPSSLVPWKSTSGRTARPHWAGGRSTTAPINGTTNAGGTGGVTGPNMTNGAGVLYSMSTSGSGFTVLHNFDGDLNTGPQGMIIFGQDGAIYGTQFGGGTYNQGVNWRMLPGGPYQVIYNFFGTDHRRLLDGANPKVDWHSAPTERSTGRQHMAATPPARHGLVDQTRQQHSGLHANLQVQRHHRDVAPPQRSHCGRGRRSITALPRRWNIRRRRVL